ncbi:hypothetical protein pb186bvf_005181 [Paramecium bursaria]
MSWNPYFVMKENIQHLDVSQIDISQNLHEDESSILYNNPMLSKKSDKITVSKANSKISSAQVTQLASKLTSNMISPIEKATVKYKKNTEKQNSCIPFQMNLPQSTVTKQLTKVAQQGLKPIFGIKNKETPKNNDLKGSAVWERKEVHLKTNITFESFLKEQNQSRNSSMERQTYKKNSRQYSHQLQVNHFMQSKQNISTNSQYSTCDQPSQPSFKKNIQIQDNSYMLSDRTVKKESPLALLQHKKNTRCISMDQQKPLQTKQIELECEEHDISVIETTPRKQQPEQQFQIGGFTQESIQALMLQELEYSPDPQYMQKQPNLNPMMRAILLDWMMEVSSEFLMKRETYHLAVMYVDKYLSKLTILKSELQLLGVTSMFIASKMEEVYPAKAIDFSKSADYGYTSEQILEMELKIYKVLQWHLNPPTLNLWLGFYTGQWDLFIKDSSKKFRQPGEDSYQNFRTLYQLIDCAQLDIQSLSHKPRSLIAGFMYLVLGEQHGLFNRDYIRNNIPYTSKFLTIDQQNNFNLLFTEFLQFSFGFNLVDLVQVIQFAASFFDLQMDFNSPQGLKEPMYRFHFEEFLSHQTHNQSQLQIIKSRR